MKRKWLNKQFILSLFFFLLFIGVVVVNELDLFKKLTTIPVVMAEQAIDKDTVITEDMLFVYQMPPELVNDQMFQKIEDVVGKTAIQFIPSNQFVVPTALDTSILRPTSEHEFFPIPDHWLVLIQGTLRRYDLVNISAIQDSEEKATSKTAKKNEFILENVPVAYVKDNRNGEVTGVSNGDDRLYGTTRPSSIQLSLTLEQFKELEALVLDGHRLIISY